MALKPLSKTFQLVSLCPRLTGPRFPIPGTQERYIPCSLERYVRTLFIRTLGQTPSKEGGCVRPPMSITIVRTLCPALYIVDIHMFKFDVGMLGGQCPDTLSARTLFG